jgi:uncharacterized protein
MKIVIAGGSGQVGSLLAHHYHSRGDAVAVLTRRLENTKWRAVVWDGRTGGEWEDELVGADVVINLAGRSVNCRYTPRNRREIISSRLEPTWALGKAISESPSPPKLWLQASTATIYAHRYDAPNDEHTGVIGGLEPDVPDSWRFSIDVATSWENAALEAPVPHTRRVFMRSALTMHPESGSVFDTLLRLVRFGLGGQPGDGQQYVSWIHWRDFIRALDWIIETKKLDGPINIASPNPLPNHEFMRHLRKAWGARIGLPAPAWMVDIGAFFLRTESELVLKSRRVIPARLQESGFTFNYPQWETAAEDLVASWRTNRAKSD